MSFEEKQLRERALQLLLQGESKQAANLAFQADVLANDASIREFAEEWFREAPCQSA